jgi:chorismate synthase
MSGNSFGNIFKITTFGESHGVAIGCIIDGMPSDFLIDREKLQRFVSRRRPGQSQITTDRQEEDSFEIISGVFEGKTTGSPIAMMIKNKDQKSNDYNELKDVFRPSHADYVYHKKYGIRDHRGGGRSSARETAARVMAGGLAMQYLEQKCGIEIVSFVEQIHSIKANIDYQKVNIDIVDEQITRCPDVDSSRKMIDLIEKTKADGDSLGGIVTCVIRNCPVGLGCPVFDKLSADLGKAMLSINAVKGFEVGDGFSCIDKFGSQNNDEFFIDSNQKIKTRTNNSGGIVAGISNGDNIVFRVAFKPTSTIKKPQNTVDLLNQEVVIQPSGRHDPCVLPRAVPIVDAMAAITILDHYLIYKSYESNQ